MKSDEFRDKGFDETGSFGDVVNGLVGEEENAFLNHFFVVDFVDKS